CALVADRVVAEVERMQSSEVGRVGKSPGTFVPDFVPSESERRQVGKKRRRRQGPCALTGHVDTVENERLQGCEVWTVGEGSGAFVSNLVESEVEGVELGEIGRVCQSLCVF